MIIMILIKIIITIIIMRMIRIVDMIRKSTILVYIIWN